MNVAIVSTLVAAGFVLSPVVTASGMALTPTGQDGTGMLDAKMEYRMRIARADAEHEKLHDSADEIARLSLDLSDRARRGEVLRPEDVKVLDRIRKLARKMRSDLGGGGDAVLEEKPVVVRDAMLALGTRGAEFAKIFSRSSRFVVDARVIKLAGEIVVLTEFLKPHAR